jgi:adenine-specific DNA-methyltransferase
MFGRALADGFDIVIGNPPFVLLQNMQLDPSCKSNLMDQYVSAQYKVDLYHLFIEAGIAALSPNGIITYITPNTFLKNKHTNRLRELMVTKTKIKSVVLFYRRVFEDPSVDNLIFLCERTCLLSNAMANTIRVSEIQDGDLEEQLIASRPFAQSNIKSPDFSFELDITIEAAGLLSKIENGCVRFGEIGGSYFGIQTFDRATFVSSEKLRSSFNPVIDGGNVFRFYIKPSTDFVDFRPQAIKSGGNPEIYSKDRIVVRQIGKYPEGAFCPGGLFTLNTIYNLYLDDEGFNIYYVLAIVNSKIIRYYWLCRFFDNKKTFPKIKKGPLHSLPIKRCDSIKQGVFVELANQILAAKKINPAADTSALEREIDQHVYALYGLTSEEIAIVESSAL